MFHLTQHIGILDIPWPVYKKGTYAQNWCTKLAKKFRAFVFETFSKQLASEAVQRKLSNQNNFEKTPLIESWKLGNRQTIQNEQWRKC